MNLFKDMNLPGGNMEGSPWRGVVGQTTWEFLDKAEPIELPCTPDLPFIPPVSLNVPVNAPWTQFQLDVFKLTESGVAVIWDGVHPKLRACYENFTKMLADLGMSIRATSAKRLLIQQAHFWDLVLGEASKTSAGKEHARKHGLASKVSKPNPNAPHVLGIAVDAVITDSSGKRMNPLTGAIDEQVLKIANKCGFKKPPVNDGVHWQLA